MMDIRDALSKAPIFEGIGEEGLAEILKIVREKRFQKDEMIMQEGDEGSTMYMILEGELGVSKALTMKFGEDDYRKTEKVLNRLTAKNHAVFGEMALIAEDKRSASIQCNTECVLLEISRDDFIRLVESRPELGVRILLNLSRLLIGRLRQASQDIMRLTTALSIALSK
ncbi:MAG: cyclic nucleotide-binding domain-containing protein [Thermodesulfobacteriota bacterium]